MLITLFTAYVILHLADLITTYIGLSRGFKELNPFLRNLMNRVGVLQALLLIKIPTLAITFYVAYSFPWILIPLVIGYVILIGWNLYQLL